MMKKMIGSTLLATTLLSTTAMAEVGFQGASLGAQAGIFGIGANAKAKFTNTLGAKVGFDTFTYNDYEITYEEMKYNFDAELQDFLATVEWHPYGSSFKASAGMMINNSNLSGTVKPINDTILIGNKTYSTDQVAKVGVEGDFDPIAPYVGIGWDTSWDKKSVWGFTFDLGLVYQGAASTDYNVVYTSAAAEALLKSEIDSRIEVEKTKLQDELDKYEFLPYISIGINYKF